MSGTILVLGVATVVWARDLSQHWEEFAPVTHSLLNGESWGVAAFETRRFFAFPLFFSMAFLWLSAREAVRYFRRDRK